MKITEIQRTISGSNYSNVSMKASIGEGEDPIKASVELDTLLHKSLLCINENEIALNAVEVKKREQLNKLEILKCLVNEKAGFELPF
jgi:hypothetical protein